LISGGKLKELILLERKIPVRELLSEFFSSQEKLDLQGPGPEVLLRIEEHLKFKKNLLLAIETHPDYDHTLQRDFGTKLDRLIKLNEEMMFVLKFNNSSPWSLMRLSHTVGQIHYFVRNNFWYLILALMLVYILT
jgi:hypothetical protein